MTLRKPQCSVNPSISPVTTNVPAPSGAESEDKELLGDEKDEQPLAPGGDEEKTEGEGDECEAGEDEGGEVEDGEVRRPRVGVRPTQPTKA